MRTRKRIAPDLSINIKAPSKLLTEEQAKEILRRHIETAEGHTDLKLRSGASATLIWRAALPEAHTLSTPIPRNICVALGFSRVRAYRWNDADKQ
jgi:hypothetical protein